jgi:hypothetical protein
MRLLKTNEFDRVLKNCCCDVRSIFFNNALNGRQLTYGYGAMVDDSDRAKPNSRKAWPNATSSIIKPPTEVRYNIIHGPCKTLVPFG